MTKNFKAALKQVADKRQEKMRSVEVSKESTEDEFFSFEPSQLNEPKDTLTQDVEMLTFFSDTCTDITCLGKYPTIKEFFLQYNTPLPSSAAVERLFSLAGNVYAPRRNRLSDSVFEKLVILKPNQGLFLRGDWLLVLWFHCI